MGSRALGGSLVGHLAAASSTPPQMAACLVVHLECPSLVCVGVSCPVGPKLPGSCGTAFSLWGPRTFQPGLGSPFPLLTLISSVFQLLSGKVAFSCVNVK